MVTFIAVMETRDGLPLVPIVGGVIGGVLTLIILSVLMVLLIIIMCRIVYKQRRSNTDINLSKFLFLYFYSMLIRVV